MPLKSFFSLLLVMVVLTSCQTEDDHKLCHSNGIWISHGWLGDNAWFQRNARDTAQYRDDDKIENLAILFAQHDIKYIYVDSDGDASMLIPIWLEVGINGTTPIEIAAGMDPVALRKEYGKDLYLMGGIDKRELARNNESIRAEVRKRLLPLVDVGGYLPGVDHAVPADVSFENHAYYVDCIREVEREIFGN